MSHFRVCLLAFFVLGVVVTEFADSTNNKGSCDKEVTPGSEYTQLSIFEVIAKPKLITIKKIKDTAKDIKNIAKNITEKILGIKSEKKNVLSYFNDFMNNFEKIYLIPPGLLWCGAGNKAKHDDDLGYFNDTDACCRAHDMCNNNIPAGETLLNLKNGGFYTRSACTCDDAFYKCLKKVSMSKSISLVSKQIAKKIAKIYFNILRPQCFRCSCLTAECKDNDDTEYKSSCKKYEWRNNIKFIS